VPERGGWFLGFVRIRGRLLLVLKDVDGEIEVVEKERFGGAMLGRRDDEALWASRSASATQARGSAREVEVGRERDGEQAPLAAREDRRRHKGPPRNLTALAEREGDRLKHDRIKLIRSCSGRLCLSA
jgi:hypothetical protein